MHSHTSFEILTTLLAINRIQIHQSWTHHTPAILIILSELSLHHLKHYFLCIIEPFLEYFIVFLSFPSCTQYLLIKWVCFYIEWCLDLWLGLVKSFISCLDTLKGGLYLFGWVVITLVRKDIPCVKSLWDSSSCEFVPGLLDTVKSNWVRENLEKISRGLD